MPERRRRPSRDRAEQIMILLLRIAEEVIRIIDELRRIR
jgi:hypothetical protein